MHVIVYYCFIGLLFSNYSVFYCLLLFSRMYYLPGCFEAAQGFRYGGHGCRVFFKFSAPVALVVR